jgi:hypothetical protein
MTGVVRAASTTSLVTKVSSLMLRIRWIWTKSRWMCRKLPLVIRAIVAMAWGVAEVGGVEFKPELAPVLGQDEGRLVFAEWPGVVGEADAAVKLG